MTSNSLTKLPQGLRQKVPLRREQEISVKRHCTGVLRHVVGYYENMALKDPTGKRFVYASPDAVLAGINKRHKVSRRSLYDALKTARDLNIISETVKRVREGKTHDGVMVTHPSALIIREGAWSLFKGKLDPPPVGRWREENGVTFWQGRGTLYGFRMLPDGTKVRRETAPALHSDCTGAALPLHSDCTATALEKPKSCTENCTCKVVCNQTAPVPASADTSAGCTDSAVQKLVPSTPPDQDSLQSRMRAETLETVETVETLKTNDNPGTESERSQREVGAEQAPKQERGGEPYPLTPTTENRTPKTRSHERRRKPVLSPGEYREQKAAETLAADIAETQQETAERMWRAWGLVPDGNGGWRKPAEIESKKDTVKV